MSEHVISCYPSGIVEAVQNDDVPLHELGKSIMTRASSVEWDKSEQKWRATINEEFRREGEAFTFLDKSRTVCISWEIAYLNRR